PHTLCGLRDRAMLLLGFAAGFRRSELAALDCAAVEDAGDGLTILIRRNRNPQESRKIEIACSRDPDTCPVLAFRTSVTAARITEGLISRRFFNRTMSAQAISGRVVALTIKKAAERVGIDAQSLRPLAAQRSRDDRGSQWRERSLDHATDRPQIGDDG